MLALCTLCATAGTVRTRPHATAAPGGGARVTLPPPTMSAKSAAAATPQAVASAPDLLDLSTVINRNA